MKAIIIIIFALLILTAGCNSDGKESSSNAKLQVDNANRAGTMKEIAVFETSEGNIEVELNRQSAPITVDNFVKYVNSGQYSGLIFHRVIKGFMIQGGGFSQDGTQKKTSEPIKLESDKGQKNLNGTIAMARTSEPNSATAQFFINTANNGFLDRNVNNDGYAVFGKVIYGMDVVNKIESSQTTTKGPFENYPVKDIVIKKAYMKP